MRVDFVHLAGRTAANVFCYKCFHVGLPIVWHEKLQSFGNSRVASSYLIVKKGCYTPSKFVCHNDQSGATVPVGPILGRQIVGACPVLHSCLVISLCLVYCHIKVVF